MAEGDVDQRESVSVEAHTRVKTERDQFKTQLEQVSSTLKGVALVDKAYEHFKGKGVSDPYGLAKAASRDSLLAGVEDDALTGRLDDWFTQQQAIWGATQANGGDDTEAKAPPPATSATPPGAARPAPSPGNDGGQVKPEPLTMQSPEVREMLKKGDRAGLRELARQGRLIGSPGNPLPPAVAGQS